MADAYEDKSGTTQMFQAFVDKPEPAGKPSNLPLIIGAAVVVLLAAIVIGWFALG
ncbi:MAG TPA: hypothetical protein VF174_11315 [Micromonosporaceae bacterium]